MRSGIGDVFGPESAPTDECAVLRCHNVPDAAAFDANGRLGKYGAAADIIAVRVSAAD